MLIYLFVLLATGDIQLMKAISKSEMFSIVIA